MLRVRSTLPHSRGREKKLHKIAWHGTPRFATFLGKIAENPKNPDPTQTQPSLGPQIGLQTIQTR
ncbi:unnamed protein product [Penicillium camemberti]|uniref:Str. FM013 n=1 Tax=Penicillium camemberti (strain FM 013) TaxID=1429867 RepID=A0A0G4PED2_PENC3|nr:unnamed protein product [Penicillium camemberti]